MAGAIRALMSMVLSIPVRPNAISVPIGKWWGIDVSSPQPPVTPNIPQQVGLGIMMATAIRALSPLLIPPLKTNAISVVTYATWMVLIVGKNNPCILPSFLL